MVKSMTGYGSLSQESDNCAQHWEIRSVNSKQFSLRFRVPHYLKSQEQAWERQVRQSCKRARIEVDLNLQLYRPEAVPVSLNRPQARAMLVQLSELARESGADFEPDLNRLLNVPGVWQETGQAMDEDLASELSRGLERAIEDWNRSRAREGQALQADLEERIARMKEWLQELTSSTRDLAGEKFQNLQERVHALLDTGQVDEDRMFQELALLADKLDVTEELVRLRTHLDNLSDLLASDEDNGRKLDFLLQECFREINTCGNKAQNTTVSSLVVEMKTELEKCREQVQNLE
jgi:uncharacterized protein (TIGR00255 family)